MRRFRVLVLNRVQEPLIAAVSGKTSKGQQCDYQPAEQNLDSHSHPPSRVLSQHLHIPYQNICQNLMDVLLGKRSGVPLHRGSTLATAVFEAPTTGPHLLLVIHEQ